MSNSEQHNSVVRELDEAIDELHSALQRASGATATIKGLLPRVSAISSVFDELEAVIESGRQQFGANFAQQQAPATFARPTLVPSAADVPAVEIPTSIEPAQAEAPRIEPEVAPFEAPKSGAAAAAAAAEGELTSFRLEFESRPGPLDLRAVDEAVSDHPAVRDVALLDYDGRKATLKVWIVSTAQPLDVQDALTNRASNLFPGGNDVTIVAMEDVA